MKNKFGTKHKGFARQRWRNEKKRRDSRASYQNFERRNFKTLLWSLEEEKNSGFFLLEGLMQDEEEEWGSKLLLCEGNDEFIA